MSVTPVRTAVLLSGSGRTLANLLQEVDRGSLPIEIVDVVSNRRDAFGLQRARQRSISTRVVRRADHPDLHNFSSAMAAPWNELSVELVLMAGYLEFFEISDGLRGRVLNIHPALLPAFGGHGFYGCHVHDAVWKKGVKITGCTVHFVNDKYDDGPIILQRAVGVTYDDTPQTIADKVFAAECLAYPEAIRLYCERRLKIVGSRVEILPSRSG